MVHAEKTALIVTTTGVSGTERGVSVCVCVCVVVGFGAVAVAREGSVADVAGVAVDGAGVRPSSNDNGEPAGMPARQNLKLILHKKHDTSNVNNTQTRAITENESAKLTSKRSQGWLCRRC